MKLRLVLGLQCHRLPCLGLGLSLVFVLLSAESASSSKYDRENWVNPDDMINYDRPSKTMNRPRTYDNHREGNKQNTEPRGKQDCARDNIERENALMEKLAKCETTLSDVLESESLPPSPEGGGTTERQYMRRFVNVLLRALGLADEEGGTLTSSVHVSVSADQLDTLRRFGGRKRPTVALSELDDILSQVLRPADEGQLPGVGWLARTFRALASGDALYRLLPYAITLVTLAMLVMRRQVCEIVATFLVLVLALSYQWTYDYMLKMAEIRQYVTLRQHEQLPAACRARTDWSLFEYLVHRLTHDADECGRYHAAQMMDPALGVTPTLVLSEMLSAMLVHPAAGLGEGVARFSAGVLGGLPMFWNWVVLILSFALFALVIVLVIVVVCGGRMRLPFLFSGLEITGGRSARPAAVEGASRVPVQEGAPRVPVQEIRPSDPLVAAMSGSSSEGLVLMNMPILERLMSARDDRAATAQHRDYVQRLAPVGDAAGACCAQCGGGDSVATSGGRGDSDTRVATLHDVGRADSDTRVATVHAFHDVTGDSDRPTRVSRVQVERASKVDPRLAGGDFARGVVSRSSRVEEAPPTSVIAPPSSVKAPPISVIAPPPSVKARPTSDLAPPPSVTAPPPSVAKASGDGPRDCARLCARALTVADDGGQLERSAFIDELRKILDESDTDQAGAGAREGVTLTQEGRPDLADTLANLLDECDGPQNLPGKRSVSATEPTAGTDPTDEVTAAELTRKVSSDSSDASGDFVKL